MCACPRHGKAGRTACKHIHAVHSLFDVNDRAEVDLEEDVDVVQEDVDVVQAVAADEGLSPEQIEHEELSESASVAEAVRRISEQHKSISKLLQVSSVNYSFYALGCV
jgi:hypothetical protein